MDSNELIQRIRDGSVDEAVQVFLAANPSLSLENLVAGALPWGLDDVSEALLLTLLKEQPEHEAAHDQLSEMFYRQKRYSECIPHYTFLCGRFPNRVMAYSRLCWSYFLTRDMNGLRDTVHAAQRNIVDGHHLSWQAGGPIALYLSPEDADAHRTRHGSACAARAENRQAPPTRLVTLPVPVQSDASTATTLSASEFGTTAAVLSAAVASPIEGAEYRFEYGPARDALRQASPWRPVPGNLNAEFITSPHHTPAVYSLYAASLSWSPRAEAYVMDWPFGKDPNHLSGIGFMELMSGLWPNSCQYDGNQEINLYESCDLRDAEFTLRLHIEDVDAKDFLYCIGVGNVRTYWMLTSCPFDLSSQGDDGTVEVSFRLSSDPACWTAFGNNPTEQQNFERYQHGPLHDSLSQNVGNLVFTGAFGDWHDTPTGRIGIKGATLKYRDNSILHPDSGTVLSESPTTACDPANLTNGRRGDPDGGWFHRGPVSEPLVFRWRLAKPWSISTLVLHQDVVWPTRKCRIGATTAGGQTHSWEIDLPYDNDPLIGLRQLVIRLPSIGPCREFFIEFLEGATTDGLGLEAIELFAADYVPPPSTVPVSVSEEITGLSPGSTVYYRVTCRSGDKVEKGETATIVLPASDAPLLHDVRLQTISADKAIIRIRANAMGHETDIRWQLDGGDWRETPLGWLETAAHRYITLHALAPGRHNLKVLLKSPAGESPPRTLAFDFPS